MLRFERNTQPKLRSTTMILSIVLSVLILCNGASADDLHLSEPKNIADLTLNVKSSVNISRLANSQGVTTKTLTYHIEVASCALSKRIDGHDSLLIEGLSSLMNPGRPQLPTMTLTAKIDKNATVLGIEVVGGSYRDILNTVNFTNAPAPRVWMRPQDVPEHVRSRYQLVSASQPPDGYFPGEMVSYHAGKDNATTYVYVKAYPVQYNPRSQKAVLITDARINVYYSIVSSGTIALQNLGQVDPAESVIICPTELALAAERLKTFHIEKENISTSVVTTEDIDAVYSPATDPPFLGYSGNAAGKDKIVGYNYDLAKKIVAYLRDREQHPNLSYVTLLGDGLLVPPSYYINEWAIYEWYDYESYYDWIPTDFLYSSPDYDYVANYKVGRLPVSDADQAASVVEKIERWHDGLSWDWFKRASFGGGRPFGTMWYYGELSSVDLINKDTFNGMELTKFYYTEGTYDVNDVKPILMSKPSGLFYHVDHGSGQVLAMGEGWMSASELMIPEDPRHEIFNPNAPVVVSVSCINGAYDTDMTAFEDQPEFDAVPYPTSFGEATVLSNAGGIAYIGGSRLNLANFNMFYDEGRLLAHHYYMVQICNMVFESYHNGAGRIGDMMYSALRRYAQDSLISDSSDRETLFGFVLLGDPVLSIPAQQPEPSCHKPHLAAVEPDGYSSEGIPVYRDLPMDQSRTVGVASSSDSSTVDVTSIYTWHDTIVKKDVLCDPSSIHTFTPTHCGHHLVRAAADDGKEGWLYVNTQFLFVPTSDVLLIDADDGMDYESYYTASLDNLGRAYDIWENGARVAVDAQTLSGFNVVIWFLPYSEPSEWEKNAFGTYLDNGGNLFITGQDIGSYITSYGNQVDNFYRDYLHAEWVDWAYEDTLHGQPRDPIGGGVTITIWGGDGANNQFSTDEIEPIAPAVPVFTYEPGCEAALRVDTGTYKVVYFGFGFEGIDSQASRDEVMKRVLHWLDQN